MRIRPVSDLRSYSGVLRDCQNGEPVYVTKHGTGRYVLMDIQDYERQRLLLKVLSKLADTKTGE
jgi:prevent-host-death family protein